MTSLTKENYKELMSKHQWALTNYAKRIFDGEELDTSEEEDRVRRMGEFFTTGTTLGCTQNELASVLFKDLFRTEKACGCINCRSRK